MNNEQSQFENYPTMDQQTPIQTPTQTPEPTPIAPPPSMLEQPMPVQQPPVKKKHTTLIASIIIAMIILVGGGIFAAFAIIKNTPTNIILDSLNNLTNSNQIAINGNAKLTSPLLGYINVSSANLNFNAQRIQPNHSSDLSLVINFTDGTSITIDSGRVLLQNNILYAHIDGINELYHNYTRDYLASNIESVLRSRYISRQHNECYDQYLSNNDVNDDDNYANFYDCTAKIYDDPEIDILVAEQAPLLLSQFDELIAAIDGQWFEFSFEDILNHNFTTEKLRINEETKQTIRSSYHCYTDMTNQMSKYSSELSEYYSKYPFINLISSQDDYYDVSLDANYLTGYIDNISRLNVLKDYTKCTNTTLPDSPYEITVEDVESAIRYFPTISARFDGFLNHRLTNLKINHSDTYYSFSTDVNFDYQPNSQISAPNNSQPIMDFVQEYYNKFSSFFND